MINQALAYDYWKNQVIGTPAEHVENDFYAESEANVILREAFQNPVSHLMRKNALSVVTTFLNEIKTHDCEPLENPKCYYDEADDDEDAKIEIIFDRQAQINGRTVRVKRLSVEVFADRVEFYRIDGRTVEKSVHYTQPFRVSDQIRWITAD